MTNPFADTSTLDYIAFKLYEMKCVAEGHTPIRWMCLKPELQKQFLEIANAKYLDWVESERTAQVRRSGP